MKYIFFGTPDVGSETLKRLVDAGYKPEVVVTNPDAPKGRGQQLTPSPTKKAAEALGISVLAPEKLDEDFIKKISSYGADLAIVVAYGKILPESLINYFPQGILNIHYSLLPRWRGASPVESALLHGDQVTGVTIQKMVKKLDAGDVLAVKDVEIQNDDTAASLRPRLIEEGANLLIEILPKYLDGSITPLPQDESLVTYAPKYSKGDGEINLNGDHKENWNKYRAFILSPGVYFFENDQRFKIKRARFENDQFVVERVVPEGGKEIDYRP